MTRSLALCTLLPTSRRYYRLLVSSFSKVLAGARQPERYRGQEGCNSDGARMLRRCMADIQFAHKMVHQCASKGALQLSINVKCRSLLQSMARATVRTIDLRYPVAH